MSLSLRCSNRLCALHRRDENDDDVSSFSNKFVITSHKAIVAYLTNKMQEKCCPLFTTSSTVLLPHLRESTFDCVFVSGELFADVLQLNLRASLDSHYDWVSPVTEIVPLPTRLEFTSDCLDKSRSYLRMATRKPRTLAANVIES